MIPLATTTITVRRPGAAEPYEPASYSTVATGIAAHISGPAGIEIGGQEDVQHRLTADTVDLGHLDRITDAEGQTYEVVWARPRVGLGLDHTVAGLRQTEGIA